jgi:uncharacterized membrane protein YjgN (DUF898 family)
MGALTAPCEMTMNRHLSEQLETEQGGNPTVVRYDGETGEIFVLSLRVGFMTLATLGLYRFWATTRVRRWFWSQVTIDDEPLEYSGTGFELFVAFVKVALVVAAVLIPLRLALNFFDPSSITGGILFAAQVLLFGLLYVFAVYYARRYRLTRTQWHGIRANLVGSSLDYLKLNVGYLMLTTGTLGVAFPYYRIATRRYLLDNTWFGDQKFSCTAHARSLMGRWLICLAVGFLLAGFIGFKVWGLVLAQEGDTSPATMGPAVAKLIGFSFLVALVLGLLFISYRTAELRVLVDGLTFQNVRVSSNLDARRMLRFALGIFGAALLCVMALGLVLFVTAATLAPLFGMLIARTGGQMMPAMILLPILFILPFYLAFSVFPRCCYNGLLRRVVNSLSLQGAPDLARIGQTPQPIPRWGEGMLEAFDFAA